MRCTLSNLLFLLKLPEQGRQYLLEIVEDWPQGYTGYVDLAEAHLGAWSGLPLDKEKASEYLEIGLQRVPKSGEDRDFLLYKLEEFQTRELIEIPEGRIAP